MILSQLLLEPHHKAAARDLASPYEMHRTVRRLCPRGTALWRLEEGRLLLQSAEPPDWSLLPEGYARGLPAQRAFRPDQLQLDQPLCFRLLANVEVRRRETRKRVPVRDFEGQADWLERNAERLGATIESVTVKLTRPLMFVGKKQEETITLNACLFEGILRVRDRELFERAISQGIGSAKAFGMGLLSLAPPPSRIAPTCDPG